MKTSSFSTEPESHHQPENQLVTVREAVGVFPDDEHLLAAIDELELAEFSRHDISVLGTKGEMERIYNKSYRDPVNLEDDERAPRGVYVMPEEQSLAEAALVGAGIIFTIVFVAPFLGATGAYGENLVALLVLAAIGGLVGYGLALWLRRSRLKRWKEQIRRGGLLLWVNTPNHDMERKAQDILRKHGARDVHVNEVTQPI